ncbi:Asp-tRNA(Asn)/Glu-tRNA(Gln) amidotransferase subunit GatC [Aminipila terrae]|uniref:Aspartyl/glutamyl-tRNA(Asn/Gln) amidotransferase subunit C n=1 Tax=Aminipila terrae TaxID=2697030 RepID=A0A6P1MNP6_9FIRM|nr:Asp-tRNA(Asn)/Glu-tRNA(Gln) amidotransferase subunit GatC [Aminipila terrae]QHI73296.1 Asp-tRNA(Asn)/Glu-tRNA(Gln) amidotransferase subunit GatC [Aminipila terrae]
MIITDSLIDYISDLSRLELEEEEKQRAKKDLTDILNYMDKLNELDTKGMSEMSHPFDNLNCFREDDVTNRDKREEMLMNAPDCKGDYFKVHKTVE